LPRRAGRSEPGCAHWAALVGAELGEICDGAVLLGEIMFERGVAVSDSIRQTLFMYLRNAPPG
jgi:hypothetical protein